MWIQCSETRNKHDTDNNTIEIKETINNNSILKEIK